MKCCKDLVKAARDSVLNLMENKRAASLERFDALLKDYVDACILSNGKIPDRCKHWEMNAIKARKALEKFICGNGGEIPRK